MRKDLLSISNGFMAKKMIKAKNKHLIREDFDSFSTQWMLWVVWQKTQQNREFQELLKSIPDTAVIIEDSSEQTSKTATLWGCKNDELATLRKEAEKRVKAQYKDEVCKTQLKRLRNEAKMAISDVGTFRGKNNMGKILTMCKRALEAGTEPPIDYGLLKESGVYLGDSEKVF
ncbi:MAG: hypothetical protein LUD72_02605 [Bacteroidales bacterium]|nr:hypothetical protein [Bacteroidales bacterium]